MDQEEYPEWPSYDQKDAIRNSNLLSLIYCGSISSTEFTGHLRNVLEWILSNGCSGFIEHVKKGEFSSLLSRIVELESEGTATKEDKDALELLFKEETSEDFDRKAFSKKYVLSYLFYYIIVYLCNEDKVFCDASRLSDVMYHFSGSVKGIYEKIISNVRSYRSKVYSEAERKTVLDGLTELVCRLSSVTISSCCEEEYVNKLRYEAYELFIDLELFKEEIREENSEFCESGENRYFCRDFRSDSGRRAD